MPWTVDWTVLVNGRDLTAAWDPVLIDIEVSDQDGTASDSCSLTVDDSGGQVRLPRRGERLEVRLEGVKVFEGVLEQPLSTGSRNAGRVLKLKAKGFDVGGKAKEPQSFHLDDAPLERFLGEAAERAGFRLQVDPSFAGIVREYWSAEGESLLALGDRLARRLGGTFKLRGDIAVLARRGEGRAPGGGSLPTVAGVVGRNVISWSITPRDPRRRFASGSARWFDRAAATYRVAQRAYGTPGKADNAHRAVMADEAEAAEANDARQREGEREDGGGSVELDLLVEAQAEGTFVLSGARPGVDGSYRIASVRHRASRSGGATTSLELKQPGNGADADERRG